MIDIKKPDISIIEHNRRKIIEVLKQIDGAKRMLQEIEKSIREQANVINIKE